MADAAPLSPAEAAAVEAALAAARAFTITLWTLYAFGVVVTVLRTYARVVAVGWKRLEMDDFLAWVAIVSPHLLCLRLLANRRFFDTQILYTTQVTLGYEIGNLARGLANNGMTDAQREALLPTDAEYGMRVVGSKIQVAGWSCYSTLMLVLKFSMLFFYLRLVVCLGRLTDGRQELTVGLEQSGLGRPYRIRVHIGFALVVVGYVASIGAVLFSCLPFHQYWQISPDPGNLCHPAVSRTIVWSSFAANVSTDIYLILIPIPLLWGSRLRIVQKILSTLVLGAGIFVLVCATLKTIFVVTVCPPPHTCYMLPRLPEIFLTHKIQDEVNGAELAGAWGTRETFVAVVTTNLPMVFPLIKQWLRPILGSTNNTSAKQYKTPTGFRTIGGGDGGGGSNSRRNGGTHGSGSRSRNTKKPLTNVSFTESEERIVNEIKLQNMGGAGAVGQKDKGIVVHTQFDVEVDRVSTLEERERANKDYERNATRLHEPW